MKDGSGKMGAHGPAAGGRRHAHGPAAMMPGEKAKDFKGTFKKFLNYLGRYKLSVLAVILFAMASTVFS